MAVLYGKTLKPTLVNMPLTGSSVVDMLTLCVRQRHPSQEVTHAAIFRWLQHKMRVIGHQLIAQDTAWITLKPLGKDSLERVVVSVFLKNSRAGIATVQGVVNAIRFIGSFWSRHKNLISQPAF